MQTSVKFDNLLK